MKMPSMIRVVMALFFATRTAAFLSPRPSFVATTTTTTRYMSSPALPNPEEAKKKKLAANPGTAFGKPISEEFQQFNKASVGFLKNSVFDLVFADRDIARFYALETIARVPYFSYLSVLHLYETIGLWRKASYLKIHFAESWNELHHLLIMEELGGANRWADRFVAQHIAVAYYWLVCFMYMFNPVVAYNLNEAIEEHAFSSYDKYIKENEERLKSMPAPAVAKEYYQSGDLYMFDEFQTGSCEPRRPDINNLHDVFCAIREDEKQHVMTMNHLQTDVELTTSHDEGCAVPDDIEMWSKL